MWTTDEKIEEYLYDTKKSISILKCLEKGRIIFWLMKELPNYHNMTFDGWWVGGVVNVLFIYFIHENLVEFLQR